MTDLNEKALKPCPFCGGEAKQTTPDQPHGGMVYCHSCGAGAFGPKWNRRALTSATPPDVAGQRCDDALISSISLLRALEGGNADD